MILKSKIFHSDTSIFMEWGNMVITQEGNLITGHYEHDSGVLEGTLNGKQ